MPSPFEPLAIAEVGLAGWTQFGICHEAAAGARRSMIFSAGLLAGSLSGFP